MLLEAGSEAEEKQSGTNQEVAEDLALLVTPTGCDPK